MWPSACFCSISAEHSAVSSCLFLQPVVSPSGSPEWCKTARSYKQAYEQWYQRLAKNFAFSFRILNYWNLALVWERELPSSSETFLKYVHTNTVPCALLSFPQLSPSPDLIAQSTHSFQAFSTPSELTYSFHPWGRSWGHLHVRVGS